MKVSGADKALIVTSGVLAIGLWIAGLTAPSFISREKDSSPPASVPQTPRPVVQSSHETSPSPSSLQSPFTTVYPSTKTAPTPTRKPTQVPTKKPAPKPTTEKPPTGNIKPGAFCSPTGSTGYYNGNLYTCKGPGQSRWRR